MPTKKTTTKKAKKATIKKAVAKKIEKKKTPATKKTVANKAVTKKASTKKSVPEKRTLKTARGSACFWMRDGLILENLLMLHNAFEMMPEEEFYFHVTKEKNDFADWVEKVLNDAACATALRKSRKPHTARAVVARHLRFYNI